MEPQSPGAMITLSAYYDGDRYDRYQGADFLPAGAVTKVSWRTDRFVSSSVNLPADTALGLEVDGVMVAQQTFPAGSNAGSWTFDATGLAAGDHAFRITGLPPNWTTPTVPMFVINGPLPEQKTVGVMLATYDLMHSPEGKPVHQFAYVPARFEPTTQPLLPRECPPFFTVPDRGKLVMTELAKCRPDDIYRPSKDKRGIWVVANRQPYFWDDLLAPISPHALLDGPRGRGTVVMPTSLQVGRNGKVYFTDSWRFGVVEPDGTVRTLAGDCDDDTPRYWADNIRPRRRVGDWSAVPEERRGFRELWKMVWDPASLLLDPAAQPIGGEQPHVPGGPVAFVTDSQRGRVCRIEFSPIDRSQPAKITEFITGLGYPWGMAIADGVLYVSERTGNRVCAYDAKSGVRLTTWAFAAPEGLGLLDGQLYVGSKAARSIVRLDLKTEQRSPFRDLTPFINNNSLFVDFGLSTEGFGERGTLGLVTWSNIGYGFPHLFRPGGQEITYLWGGSPQRVGIPWLGSMGRPAPGYPSAVAFGPGQMVMGGSQEGLMRLSQALPGDVPAPASYTAGQAKWRTMGYHLTHGHDGFGFFGLPLPWGVSPAIDTYLQTWGHRRP